MVASFIFDSEALDVTLNGKNYIWIRNIYKEGFMYGVEASTYGGLVSGLGDIKRSFNSCGENYVV